MNFFGQNRLQYLTGFLENDAFSDDLYDEISFIYDEMSYIHVFSENYYD